MTVYRMITKIIRQVHDNSLNTDKLIHFLQKIGEGYRVNVAYHNDLHGAQEYTLCSVNFRATPCTPEPLSYVVINLFVLFAMFNNN